NARDISAQLIIALRTEKFGEFFGYLSLDESVTSDVKQFLLPDLKPDAVTEAILRPTSEKPVKGNPLPPFQKYKFKYQDLSAKQAGNLADRIVEELFASDPSGGILPAMQIVCRSLYNEASRDGKEVHEITERMYVRGGGVTGP